METLSYFISSRGCTIINDGAMGRGRGNANYSNILSSFGGSPEHLNSSDT